MKKTRELDVRGTLVRVMKIDGEDYVCLTDMAKLKSEDPSFTINHWMRNRMTIEYLGLWEELYNPNFKPTEFGRFREESGLNSFTLSPTKWIQSVNAIGIVAQSGRYGGTYARNDIAFKFAAWLSVEFELYLVKEFQRLKAGEAGGFEGLIAATKNRSDRSGGVDRFLATKDRRNRRFGGLVLATKNRRYRRGKISYENRFRKVQEMASLSGGVGDSANCFGDCKYRVVCSSQFEQQRQFGCLHCWTYCSMHELKNL